MYIFQFVHIYAVIYVTTVCFSLKCFRCYASLKSHVYVDGQFKIFIDLFKGFN